MEVVCVAYIDEEILELRELQKKQKYALLETGMYIDHEVIEFDRVSLFEKKISIMLPKTFVTMPHNMMKIKYQSENRPQLIKTSLDTSVNFYFSYFENVTINENEVGIAIRQAHDALKKTNPAFVFYDEKEEKRETSTIGWFDYKSYGLDEQMYNIMAVTPIDGKLLHVGFNCRFRFRNEWKPSAIQVLSSIWDTSKQSRTII